MSQASVQLHTFLSRPFPGANYPVLQARHYHENFKRNSTLKDGSNHGNRNLICAGRLLQNAGLQQVSKSAAAAEKNRGTLLIRTVSKTAVTSPHRKYIRKRGYWCRWREQLLLYLFFRVGVSNLPPDHTPSHKRLTRSCTC